MKEINEMTYEELVEERRTCLYDFDADLTRFIVRELGLNEIGKEFVEDLISVERGSSYITPIKYRTRQSGLGEIFYINFYLRNDSETYLITIKYNYVKENFDLSCSSSSITDIEEGISKYKFLLLYLLMDKSVNVAKAIKNALSNFDSGNYFELEKRLRQIQAEHERIEHEKREAKRLEAIASMYKLFENEENVFMLKEYSKRDAYLRVVKVTEKTITVKRFDGTIWLYETSPYDIWNGNYSIKTNRIPKSKIETAWYNGSLTLVERVKNEV